MAVLHKKEEKIQAVLGRLPKKYTHEQFVEMFIKIYSKDWGKIKSAYIKQSQDKEPGTIINMPKPDIYLKQILASYLQQTDESKMAEKLEDIKIPKVAVKKVAVAEVPLKETKKAKLPAKKKSEALEEQIIEVKKSKVTTPKKVTVAEVSAKETKKPKTAVKKSSEKNN